MVELEGLVADHKRLYWHRYDTDPIISGTLVLQISDTATIKTQV